MNKFCKFIAFSTSVVCSSTYANTLVGDGVVPDYQTSVLKVQPLVLSKNLKTGAIANKYVVTLKDAPLALYGGGTEEYSATSRLGSKGSNFNSEGLNVKTLASKRYRNYLAGKQAKAKLHMSMALKRDIEVVSNYEISLNGFSTFLTKTEVKMLQNIEQIASIEKVEIETIDTDSGPHNVGADNVWHGNAIDYSSKGEGVIVAVIDSGIASFMQPVEDIHDTDNLPPYNRSFTDKVDEDNDGVIDYEFPFPERQNLEQGKYLGDCIEEPSWCNNKLIGVLVLGDLKTEQPINRDVNDSRAYTGQDSNGHGTHTASTAAGNVVFKVKTEREIDGIDLEHYSQDFVYEKISGVAPRSHIISYKMCNHLGSCDPSLLPEIIDHAIEHGVNVINYSISGSAKRPWYHFGAKAMLAARASNIHVAASAGNTGGSGLGTVQTPGNSPWLTSVAANSNPRSFNDKVLTLSGGDQSFELKSADMIGKGATSGLLEAEIIYAADVEYKGTGTHTHTHTHGPSNKDDFFHYPSDSHDYDTSGEAPYEYEHTHLHHNYDSVDEYGLEGSCGEDTLPPEVVAGKIVICNRGVFARLTKGSNVKKVGGVGLVLINKSKDVDNVENDFHTLPAINLSTKLGDELLEWLDQGSNHKAKISESQLLFADEVSIMGGFSAKGPEIYNDNYLVPSISAPGMTVLAAGLGKGMQDAFVEDNVKTDSDFVYKTGTSMSSPHVAGMYALIASVKPDWTPDVAQSALMLTADTDLKLLGPVVRGEQTYTPANILYTGAGMAKVDRALQTGLVMNISQAEYLAADPDAKSIFIRDYDTNPSDSGVRTPEEIADLEDKVLPAGWHGDPGRLNLASMTNGSCEYSCAWQRTLKAEKANTWTLEVEHINEGIELTASLGQNGEEISSGVISVSKEEKFQLNVEVSVTENLDSDWSDARVYLRSHDSSIPDVSIPVTVKFIKGRAPEEVFIDAKRNKGTDVIEGVYTMGSDDLTLTSSPLAIGQIYTGDILRNKYPNEMHRNIDESSVIIPVVIPARSARFVVEILSTTSPDIDVYVGEDYDKDGYPDVRELDSIYFWSLRNDSKEKLDEFDPRPGTYWIMIHNYGDHFNDVESEHYDPNFVISDQVRLAVAVVTSEDDDSLKLYSKSRVERDEEFPVSLTWNKEMLKGERGYGAFTIGTSEDLHDNIATVKVDINRLNDDVQLSILSNDTQTNRAGFEILFADNQTNVDKAYELILRLEPGIIIEQFDADNYEINGTEITWQQVVPANGFAKTLTLVANYEFVDGYTDVVPSLQTILDEHEQYHYADQTIMIAGLPIFSVNASTQLAKPGEQVTLTADIIDAVINKPTLGYQWKQVSGPTVQVNLVNNTLSFTTLESNTSQDYVFEFIGSNGERSSAVQDISVFVESEETGSGSLAYLWLLALFGSTIKRKVKFI